MLQTTWLEFPSIANALRITLDTLETAPDRLYIRGLPNFENIRKRPLDKDIDANDWPTLDTLARKVLAYRQALQEAKQL